MDHYLGHHYSTRGLEHLLLLPNGTTTTTTTTTNPQQRRRRRQSRSQQLLTTKIIAEQRRQGSDPETLREVIVAHSAPALTVALRRASLDVYSGNDVVSMLEGAVAVAGCDGCYSSIEEEEEDECEAADGAATVDAPEIGAARVSTFLSTPPTFNPTSLSALFNPLLNIKYTPRPPVDLPSLRRMNSQLVADMKARTATASASTSMLFTTNVSATTTSSAGSMTAADRTREMLRTSLLSYGDIFSPFVRYTSTAAPQLACPSERTSVSK